MTRPQTPAVPKLLRCYGRQLVTYVPACPGSGCCVCPHAKNTAEQGQCRGSLPPRLCCCHHFPKEAHVALGDTEPNVPIAPALLPGWWLSRSPCSPTALPVISGGWHLRHLLARQWHYRWLHPRVEHRPLWEQDTLRNHSKDEA